MKRKHTPDFPSGWDWYEFEDEPTKEQIRYCRKHLKFLGEGSSRIVFQIDDLSVLKLATVNVGRHQNRTEYEISRYSDSVCPVFLADTDYYDWIISGYARNISETEYSCMAGTIWPKLPKSIHRTITEYHLVRGEYCDIGHFGKYCDQLVIRDYGLTHLIFHKYYQIHSDDFSYPKDTSWSLSG
jgi:hypothetical protein